MNVLNAGFDFVKFVKIVNTHVKNVGTHKQHQPTLCFTR